MKSLMKKLVFGLGILSLGALMVGCAPKTFDEKLSWGEVGVSHYLDLNDAQEAKLEDITETLRVNYPDFKEVRGTIQSTLKAELAKSQFNLNTVKAELDVVEGKVTPLVDELVDEFAGFHQTLSAEQREIILNHKKDGKGHGRRGHWRRGDKDKRPHHMQDFDLQPEQAPAFKKLLAGISSDSVDLMIANNQLKKLLKAELASDSFDKEAVRTKLLANIKIVFSSIDNRLPDYAELHRQFTEEQRGILVAMVDHWIERTNLEEE